MTIEAEASRRLFLQFLAQRFIEIEQEKGKLPRTWLKDVADASVVKHKVKALGERGSPLRRECSSIFWTHVKRLQRDLRKLGTLPRQDYNPFSFVQPSLALRALLDNRKEVAASSQLSAQLQHSTTNIVASTTIPPNQKRTSSMSSRQAHYEDVLQNNNTYALVFDKAGGNTKGTFAVKQEKVPVPGQNTYTDVAILLIELNHPGEARIAQPKLGGNYTSIHVNRPSINPQIQAEPQEFMEALTDNIGRDVVTDFDMHLAPSSEDTNVPAKFGNHSFGVGSSNNLLAVTTDTYLLPPDVTGSNKYFNDGVGTDEYKLKPKLLAIHGMFADDLVKIGSDFIDKLVDELEISTKEVNEANQNAMRTNENEGNLEVPAIETLRVVPSGGSLEFESLVTSMEEVVLPEAQLLNAAYFLVLQVPLHNTESSGIMRSKDIDSEDVTEVLKRMNLSRRRKKPEPSSLDDSHLSSASSNCNSSEGRRPDPPIDSESADSEEYSAAQDESQSEDAHAKQVRQMEEARLQNVLAQLEATKIEVAKAEAKTKSEMDLAREVELKRQQAEMDLQAAKLMQETIEVEIGLAKGRLQEGCRAVHLAEEKTSKESDRLDEMRRQVADLAEVIKSKQTLLADINCLTARGSQEAEANVERDTEPSTKDNELQQEQANQKVEAETPTINFSIGSYSTKSSKVAKSSKVVRTHMAKTNTIRRDLRNSDSLRRIKIKNELMHQVRGMGKADEEQVRYNGGIHGEEKQKQRRGNTAEEEGE